MRCRPDRQLSIARVVVAAAIAAALMPADAQALARMITDLGAIDSKQRLWLAAFGGLSLGIAFGLFLFELRSRRLAVAVRRLIDLVLGMDGRFCETSRGASAATELARLSDELMFVAQRAARERREAEQRMGTWEALFAAAFDAMFALDSQGRVTYINPAAERLFKVKADEAIGNRLSDVMLPPTHRSPDNAAFANDLATGKATGRAQELVAQRGDGRQFPVEVSIAEFGEGERRGFVAIARDISQVRRSRAELKRVRSQAAATEADLLAEISRHKRELAQRPAATGTPATAAMVHPRPMMLEPMTRGPAPARDVVFTIEEVCGDPIRKLASRAERRGLGFRYEDNELHNTPLRGDPAPLRRVLIGLVDSVARVVEAGELVVHLQSSAGEGSALILAAQVTATCMTDAQAAKLLKPFVNGPARSAKHAEAAIDFLGTRVAHNVAPGVGATFRFEMTFEADLTHLAIDLSALPAPGVPVTGETARATESPRRLQQEFLTSAARLRKHAEKPTLIALWAEAHRLKDLWQRYGGRDDIGLVTALAHTARGGDAQNAMMLARRLADALEEAARVSSAKRARV